MSATQSVCKWCSQAIHLSTTVDIPELIWISPDGAVFCPKFAKPTSHEPVAEPASTGEPGTGFYRSASLQESIAQDEAERAARPSGPPAPQTSAEPCPICGSTKSPHAVGLSCHIPTPIREINEFPAAPQPIPGTDGPEHPIVGPEDGSPCCEHCAKHPGSQWTLKVSQPVSGDAPKLFDIRDGKNRYRPCARCGAKLGMGLSCDSAGVFVRCTACSFLGPNGKNDKEAFDLWNHAFLDSPAFKDSGKHPEDCLADFLGPYFPPASQTPQSLDFHTWLTRVHGFKVGSARNSYKEADLEAAWNAGISHRPEVIGANPLCLDCHGAGIINCSHFDNCSGKWVYVATPASTARTDAMGEILARHITEGDSCVCEPGSPCKFHGVPQAEPPKEEKQ